MVNYALVLLLNQNNEVLLLHYRNNSTYMGGKHALVGGKIEAGETAAQAAIREAREEIGITIDPKDLQFKHIFHRKGTEGPFFALVFAVTKWQGEPVCQEPHNHNSVGWFALDKLPKNLLPAHRQALELIIQHVGYSEHGW